MKTFKLFVCYIILFHLFSISAKAGDPIVKIRGTQASSIHDGIDFYNLNPSGGIYNNTYHYYPVIDFNGGPVPNTATKIYEWIAVGGTATSGKGVEQVAIIWNNTKNYNNGVPTKSLRLKIKFEWKDANDVSYSKEVWSVRANGAAEAQPIEVKYISEPSTITFNGSTLSNNNTLSFACGAGQKTISWPAVVTDPNAPVTYYISYPVDWSGPQISNVASVTVNTHINKGGTIKVEAKRNDTNNFRTKISINITRPLPTKPTINSNDILLCSPQTITASASYATSYTWSTTGGVTANSPGNTNSAQITAVSDGTVKVAANSSVCAMTSAYSSPINVKKSPPQPASLIVTANGGNSPDFMCNGAGLMLNAYTAEPGTMFGMWKTSDPANTILNGNGGSAYFNTYINNCYGIDIVVSNCFGSVQKGITICVDNCVKHPHKPKIYPNPASDYVKIEFGEEAGPADLPDGVKIIQETSGKEIRAVHLSGGDVAERSFQIPVSDLPRGVYYFQLLYKDGARHSVRLRVE